jgi:hypothetical protein
MAIILRCIDHIDFSGAMQVGEFVFTFARRHYEYQHKIIPPNALSLAVVTRRCWNCRDTFINTYALPTFAGATATAN